jgi:hypothetical protein
MLIEPGATKVAVGIVFAIFNDPEDPRGGEEMQEPVEGFFRVGTKMYSRKRSRVNRVLFSPR